MRKDRRPVERPKEENSSLSPSFSVPEFLPSFSSFWGVTWTARSNMAACTSRPAGCRVAAR